RAPGSCPRASAGCGGASSEPIRGAVPVCPPCRPAVASPSVAIGAEPSSADDPPGTAEADAGGSVAGEAEDPGTAATGCPAEVDPADGPPLPLFCNTAAITSAPRRRDGPPAPGRGATGAVADSAT